MRCNSCLLILGFLGIKTHPWLCHQHHQCPGKLLYKVSDSGHNSRPWSQAAHVLRGLSGRTAPACFAFLSRLPGARVNSGTRDLHWMQLNSSVYSWLCENSVLPFKTITVTPQKDTEHLYLLSTYVSTARSWGSREMGKGALLGPILFFTCPSLPSCCSFLSRSPYGNLKGPEAGQACASSTLSPYMHKCVTKPGRCSC